MRCERRNVEKVVTEQVDKLTTRSRGREKENISKTGDRYG